MSFFFSEGPNFVSIWKNGESQCIMYLYFWRFLDQSWFKSVVYNSQYFEKIVLVLLNFLFISKGNFTTKVFKILYLIVLLLCYSQQFYVLLGIVLIKLPSSRHWQGVVKCIQ